MIGKEVEKVSDSGFNLVRDGRSSKDKAREKGLAERTNVEVILSDVKVKSKVEQKAWEALDRRLSPSHKMCKACSGEGYKMNGDSCGLCQGQGFVVEDADMRAIELVLKPKFPNTSINVNADLEGMGTEDLLDMIDGM